jgi:hypothetical protein
MRFNTAAARWAIWPQVYRGPLAWPCTIRQTSWAIAYGGTPFCSSFSTVRMQLEKTLS